MEGQGNKFEILRSEIMASQEVEIPKETSPTKASPSVSIKGGSAAERSKGKLSKEEEEVQESEESEEEGEIGNSQSSPKRSIRGRKYAREKREQETYKDKLQGSQPTLEKLLAKTPKTTRNQPHSSKRAHHNKNK